MQIDFDWNWPWLSGFLLLHAFWKSEFHMKRTGNILWEYSSFVVPQKIYEDCMAFQQTTQKAFACSELTIETPEQRQWCRSGGFIVNFQLILHIVFPLLTLSNLMPVNKYQKMLTKPYQSKIINLCTVKWTKHWVTTSKMKKKKEINFISRVSTFMLELSGETLMRINLKNRVFLVICCL